MLTGWLPEHVKRAWTELILKQSLTRTVSNNDRRRKKQARRLYNKIYRDYQISEAIRWKILFKTTDKIRGLRWTEQ